MNDHFRWNPYADQPHNVAPKKERFRHHLKHAGSYFQLLGSNLAVAFPVLSRYRRYWRSIYRKNVSLDDPFGISVSPGEDQEETILVCLKEMKVKKTLVRIPSWEKDRLPWFKNFIRSLNSEGIEVAVALLQNRDDVKHPARWKDFMEEVISNLKPECSFYEVGHAWNRTKWGVWDHREYLNLAWPAQELRKTYGIQLIGPAVIDFEFHLYPIILRKVSFDRVSSLLYVDRVGAPENTQFGWNTQRKTALLKAVVDGSCGKEQKVWITEVNWPLSGTGKYSPASGKPNVSEALQRDYLVRYYILTLASGFIERIYWWQLAAPGYGLIDNRENKWRKRPAYFALRTLITQIRASHFTGKTDHPQAEIFSFLKDGKKFSVCWTNSSPFTLEFPEKIIRIKDITGEEIRHHNNRVDLNGSPKYVFYE